MLFRCWLGFVGVIVISELLMSDQEVDSNILYWLLSIVVFRLVLSPPTINRFILPERLLVPAGVIAAFSSLALLYIPTLNFLIPNSKRFLVNEFGNLRLGGVLGDYELFAELLCLSLICLFAPWRKVKKLSLFLSVSVMTIALLLTATVSGLIAIPGVIVALAISRERIGLKVFAGSAILLTSVFLVTTYGETLVKRINVINTESSFTQIINRRTVWMRYDAMKEPSSIFGNGTTFNWDQFGLWPHSLYKSIVYMGGYIAMALFLSLVLVLVTRLRLGRSQSDYRLGMFVLLLLGVFLSNQVKVEFIRLGNYVIFIGAFFASLGLLLSKMTDSDESKLEKVQ
jgi:hypothetical protein